MRDSRQRLGAVAWREENSRLPLAWTEVLPGLRGSGEAPGRRPDPLAWAGAGTGRASQQLGSEEAKALRRCGP